MERFLPLLSFIYFNFIVMAFPVIPQLITSGLALGGNLIGGLMTNAQNAESIRETNEMNYKIAQETNAANTAINKQNLDAAFLMQKDAQSYNSAQKEVARLRAAGLNPALVYGQSASVGAESVPSSIPMQTGSAMQPVQYSDVIGNSLDKSITETVNLLTGMQQFESMNTDNEIKRATARTKINQAIVDLENSKKLGHKSDKEIEYINNQIAGLKEDLNYLRGTRESRKEAVDLKNDVLRAEAEERRANIATNAARVAIERAETDSRIRLNAANIENIRKMAFLAANADFRATEEHGWRSSMAALDRALKSLNIDETAKQNIFNETMRQIDMEHNLLKDASAVNRLAELVLGLGFRDLGNALKGLIK